MEKNDGFNLFKPSPEWIKKGTDLRNECIKDCDTNTNSNSQVSNQTSTTSRSSKTSRYSQSRNSGTPSTVNTYTPISQQNTESNRSNSSNGSNGSNGSNSSNGSNGSNGSDSDEDSKICCDYITNTNSYIVYLPSNSSNGRVTIYKPENSADFKIVKVQISQDADPILADYIILNKIKNVFETNRSTELNNKIKSRFMDIDSFFFVPGIGPKNKPQAIDYTRYSETREYDVYPAVMSAAIESPISLDDIIDGEEHLDDWLTRLDELFADLIEFGTNILPGFCHNDLHCGNILWDPNANMFKVIDFGRARINKDDFTNDVTTNRALGLWKSLRQEQLKAASFDESPDFPYDLNGLDTGLNKFQGGKNNIMADLAGLAVYVVVRIYNIDNLYEYRKYFRSYNPLNKKNELSENEDVIKNLYSSLINSNEKFKNIKTALLWFKLFLVKYKESNIGKIERIFGESSDSIMYDCGQIWEDRYNAVVPKYDILGLLTDAFPIKKQTGGQVIIRPLNLNSKNMTKSVQKTNGRSNVSNVSNLKAWSRVYYVKNKKHIKPMTPPLKQCPCISCCKRK